MRVSRLMGHANASVTLNVYGDLILREHDPSGDRLASLVFGSKMEIAEKSELTPDWVSDEIQIKSGLCNMASLSAWASRTAVLLGSARHLRVVADMLASIYDLVPLTCIRKWGHSAYQMVPGTW